MLPKLIIISLLLALVAGCSRSTSQNNAQTPAETQVAAQAAPQEQTNSAPPPPPPPPESSLVQDTPTKTPSKPSERVAPTPRPGMTLEKAGVGSAAQGRGYGQGIITTPVATYFAARERIMFEITIPDCIRTYKFEHDFKGPKTHEEFMEKVIKKYGIQLPPLPPGHQYVYDPKNEQLQVEKPQE